MNIVRIYKEDIALSNIWRTMLIELELPKDTDEITVKVICNDSPSKREENKEIKNQTA